MRASVEKSNKAICIEREGVICFLRLRNVWIERERVLLYVQSRSKEERDRERVISGEMQIESRAKGYISKGIPFSISSNHRNRDSLTHSLARVFSLSNFQRITGRKGFPLYIVYVRFLFFILFFLFFAYSPLFAAL